MTLDFYGAAVIGQRSEQQDSALVLELSGGRRLFLVADGMGGHNGGREASEMVCQTFRHYFEADPSAAEQPSSLRAALILANNRLAETSRRQPEMFGMGSTVVALIIDEETGLFNFLSVGDSPLYQWKGGQLRRLNEDHSLRSDLLREVMAGRMSPEDAACHPDRNVLKSAVFGQMISLIDEKAGVLAVGERLILASDGLQTLDDSPQGQVAWLLGQATAPYEAVNGLFEALAAAGNPYQDNATVLIAGRTAQPESVLADYGQAVSGFEVIESPGGFLNWQGPFGLTGHRLARLGVILLVIIFAALTVLALIRLITGEMPGFFADFKGPVFCEMSLSSWLNKMDSIKGGIGG